jgi:hypothetical protein
MSFAPPSNEVPENHGREAADRIRPSNQAATALENDVSLADSLIWRWQREFYAQRAMKAWTEDMVPNFLTNNPFIAGVYARVAFSFICDCIESKSQESQAALTRGPLRILELGAGPGKFAYLFLRHLTALLRSQNLPVETVRYCMTDCSEDLIQGWRKNRYLAEFVECGILQFSVFQVGEKIDLDFFRKDSLASKPADGPLVLIANYVFDSLPQDAFVIKEGQISEALITTHNEPPSRRQCRRTAVPIAIFL